MEATDIVIRDHDTTVHQRTSDVLRALADTDARPYRVLSVSLDTEWRDEQQRERVRLFVKDEARRLRATLSASDVDRALAADLDHAERIVEARVRRGTTPGGRAGRAGGLALYLCHARDLALELDTDQPLPFRLTPAFTPSLRTLVEGLRTRARALILVVDARSARLYQFDPAAGARAVADLSGADDLPRSHQAGGWSQLGLQHRREEHVGRRLRAAAVALTELFDGASMPRILLGGRAELHGSLEKLLPERVRRRVTRVSGLDPHHGDDRLQLVVESALGDLLAEDDAHLLEEVEELAGAGRAALGPDAVAAALNEQRVARLLLDARLCASAWSCPSCQTIGLGRVERCDECAAPTDNVELGDAMARRAIRQDAAVDVLRAARLHALGGVAAELRYPVLH